MSLASSLSSKSCFDGLCGHCGSCRREDREIERLIRPKVLPPIELSPTREQIMAESVKRHRPSRRPVPKVQNRRAEHVTKPPPVPSPCAECGEMRGLRPAGFGGKGSVIDGVGTICTVCSDRPKLAAIIAEIEAKPFPRSKSDNTLLSKSRLRIRRVTRFGRPFHPEATHGNGNAYASYRCRCPECCAWRTADDRARRNVA